MNILQTLEIARSTNRVKRMSPEETKAFYTWLYHSIEQLGYGGELPEDATNAQLLTLHHKLLINQRKANKLQAKLTRFNQRQQASVRRAVRRAQPYWHRLAVLADHIAQQDKRQQAIHEITDDDLNELQFPVDMEESFFGIILSAVICSFVAAFAAYAMYYAPEIKDFFVNAIAAAMLERGVDLRVALAGTAAALVGLSGLVLTMGIYLVVRPSKPSIPAMLQEMHRNLQNRIAELRLDVTDPDEQDAQG